MVNGKGLTETQHYQTLFHMGTTTKTTSFREFAAGSASFCDLESRIINIVSSRFAVPKRFGSH
jgi:hypothetical protein